MVLPRQDEEHSPAEESRFDIQVELEETSHALKDVSLMIEQSQGEVGKLVQRNASIAAHLQQVQNQIEKMSAEEIRLAYDSALDAQQRLFVMRGQLEKLQSEKEHLERYKTRLTQLGDWGDQIDSMQNRTGEKDSLSSVEMIVNAQEAERQRLSRLMHDGPAQALSNFILQVEISMRLLDVDLAQAREELSNLKTAAINTFQQVRNFSFELRPMMLDDLGLIPTVRRYVETFIEQTGFEVSLTISGTERRLEPYLEVMVFRGLQELIGNAARHSQASVVKVHIDVDAEMVRVSIDDNGVGFDPELIEKGYSLGLKLIQERAEMLGGSFEIDSVIGKGSRIIFSVPATG